MKISIRDDDLCYFTNYKEFEKAYKDIGAPVSVSVIPYAVPYHINGSPYNQEKNAQQHLLGENQELVNYLKKKIESNRIEILLHGYDHSFQKKKKGTMSEIQWKKYSDLYRDLKEGKEHLESLFDLKIKTFVSPTNYIDNKLAKVVSRLEMNISGVFTIKSPILDRTILINIFKRYLPRIKYGFSICPLLSFAKHKELCIIGISDLKTMIKQYEICSKNNWSFTIVTHYWELNQNPYIKKTLKNFIAYLRNKGETFDFVSNCF